MQNQYGVGKKFNKMKLIEIQNIIENIDTNLHDEIYYATKIYMIYLQDQIDILKEFVEHPTKPGYRRHDVLKKIHELETKLIETQIQQNENKNT